MRRLINTNFPQQFWLMFAGYILSATGASMIWPFLTIFVSERLNLPLTAVASLLTINAAAGLVSSLLAGPVIDRLGRKWVMVAQSAAQRRGLPV
jgi:MFS family permease